MTIRKTYAEMMEPLTDEEREEIEALKDIEPRPDEDSPAYSLEELREMKRITEDRKAERNKQSVTLRLSPSALAKAKSLGKGYTSILSRIIENALNDPESLRKSL